MKKVLTVMALGAVIIGGSAVAMADDASNNTINVKVQVASFAEVAVTSNDLTLSINGPVVTDATTTVSVKSNSAVSLKAKATSFSSQTDILNSVVKFSLTAPETGSVPVEFLPNKTNFAPIYNLITAGDRTYNFRASVNFNNTNYHWYDIVATNSNSLPTSQITFEISSL